MSDIIQVNPLVFGGEGESVHANMFVKLWENPDPTSAFEPQTVTLASDNYDFLLLSYSNNTSDNICKSVIVEKGKSIFIDIAVAGSGGATSRARVANRVSDTSYTFTAAGEAKGTTASSINNALIIPLVIYGFKKSLDITAIVSNVSTDARKCMMSDGVTSVEDSLDGSTDTSSVANVTFSRSGNVVTIKLYGYVTTDAGSLQFTVPSQYRCSGLNVVGTLYNITDKVNCFVDMNSSGAFGIKNLNNSAIGSSKTLYGTLTYVI